MKLTDAELDRWVYSVQSTARSPIGLRTVLIDLVAAIEKQAIDAIRHLTTLRCTYCRLSPRTWPMSRRRFDLYKTYDHEQAEGEVHRPCDAAWEWCELVKFGVDPFERGEESR